MSEWNTIADPDQDFTKKVDEIKQNFDRLSEEEKKEFSERMQGKDPAAWSHLEDSLGRWEWERD